MLSAFSTCNPSSGLCEEIVKEEVHHAVGENIAKLTEQGPWMLNHAWLIFVIPAISYFLILFFGKRLPKKGHEIGLVSMAAVSTMAIVLAFQWITRSEEFEGKVFGQTFTWWRNGDLKLGVGTHVDGLAVMMVVVVAIISTLVHIYSIEYLRGDIRYTHYFAALSLFTASMMMLVLSNNTLQLLVGWELVGLCSFMLIGHWWEDKNNSNAALKAFFTTRVGDIGLLTGVIMTFFIVQRATGTGSFSILDVNNAALSGTVGHTLIFVTALALLVGIIGKSGQFPLHTWLPDAMAGPTPVSALIHAATMVVAGVYLGARVYPVFWEGFNIGETALNPMVLVGGITILVGAALAFVQDDIKKVLAYSTVSQLGYMVMALGAGAWTAAIFHLFTHAMFKALLFLGAGSVAHSGSHHSFDMKKDMGGLRKYMPVTFATYMIGTAALTGIFPFAGFWSKDEILANAGKNGYTTFLVIGFIGALMTAAYMTRCIYLTFFGEYRGHHKPHESNKLITVPLIILAVLSATVGFLNAVPFGIEKFKEWVEPKGAFPFENLVVEGGAYIQHADFSVPKALIATVIALSGIGITYLFYWKKIGLVGLTEKSKLAKSIHTFLVNKLYLDVLYEDIIVGSLKKSIANACYWINQNILDGVVNMTGKLTAGLGNLSYKYLDQKGIDGVVNGLGSTSQASGSGLRLLQSGKIQKYAVFLFMGVIVLAFIAVVVNNG
ncbi:MAG TPA: NADH-quinone oxidoreductase subunit L [Acidimicrobiia bacterium]|nr:NADH-quinone oxidoreductase subunit L [Acidimicrobiia bacterium]